MSEGTEGRPRRLLPLTIINERSIAAARSESMAFLEGEPDLLEALQATMFASRAMGDLYPATVENLFSGHAFPVMQVQQELETSLQLALEGFYTYSFVGLRTVLELELLGVFFAVDDDAHTEVRSWLRSEDERRRWHGCLGALPLYSEHRRAASRPTRVTTLETPRRAAYAKSP